MAIRDEFISNFRGIHPRFTRFYNHILTKANLTLAQYALLSQLLQKETMSMTEISEKLHVSKPAVTNLVDRLEESNCLKRIRHPNDRRIFLIKIQPKGQKVVHDMQVILLNMILKAFDQFSDDERKTINRFHVSLSNSVDNFFIEKSNKKNNEK